MQVLSWKQPQGSTTCLETTHASDPFPLVRHGAPSTTGHLGMSQCPNLGTSLQGAGAERTCLISAIRGDTCTSFQHITAYTCCHGPAPCGAVVKEAQNRDPGKNWELNPLFDKICSFCFPPLFSLAIVLLQELRTKKRPMSQNKGFPWIPQQNFLKVHILGRKFPVRRSSSKIQGLEPYWETEKTSEVEEWGETHPSFTLMLPIEGGLLFIDFTGSLCHFICFHALKNPLFCCFWWWNPFFSSSD